MRKGRERRAPGPFVVPELPGAARLPASSRGLELHLEGDLDVALGGAAERARRVGQHRRDLAERRVAERRVRVAELRVVQQVEGLDAELGVELADLRVLDDREVDVELA